MLRKLTSLLMTLFLVITYIHPLQAQTSPVSDMENLVQRWISLEQQNTALITDWQQQEPILQQRLQLLEDEKKQLKGIIINNENNSDDITEHRLHLLELQDTMENDQRHLQQTLQVALSTVHSLHNQFPPPLVNAWQQQLDNLALSDNSLPTEDSSLQLQTVLEMLNQMEDFNNKITLHEGVIKFDDGSEVLVKQIYLGLSHAWYVSSDNSFSGYGQMNPNGWSWMPEPVVDPTIVKKAIAMLERNIDIDIIELPIVLQLSPLLSQQVGVLEEN